MRRHVGQELAVEHDVPAVTSDLGQIVGSSSHQLGLPQSIGVMSWSR
jgi:hypothetical protein